MAKAKFDRADVVAAATELFWRKGYNCASMQDVFRATGLQPGSLYNAFGNKEGLYEESVRYYGASTLKSTKEKLDASADKLMAIARYLIDNAYETQKSTFKGCMLVKSALELNSMSNDRLLAVVNDQIDAVSDLLAQALTSHYEADIAKQKASEVMLGHLGLNVLGFTNQTPENLIDSLRAMLNWLPWNDALAGYSPEQTHEG